ncbi:hypothetical protein PG996_013943 [Apiospora saccharicola]|uniref:2EXR domain-containing protein n=1 Tax=Apiospora saccharicola TaxID=335842 RepID=A0ABR1TGX2_9PEZI
MAPPFLPPELRELIWQAALEVEARSRVVPLEGASVIPRKQLASPLLSACSESRSYALRFYSLRLAVYEFPKVTCDRSIYFMPGDKKSAKSEIASRLVNMPTQQKQVGILYLNPRYDTFLRGPDFTDYFLHITHWPHTLRQRQQQQSITYVSARMDQAARYSVRNLVFAEAPPQETLTSQKWKFLYGDVVTVYDFDRARSLWGRAWFPNADCRWLHCWLPKSNVTRRQRPLSANWDSEDFFGSGNG